MLTFFTTTTAPDWTFSALDPNTGHAISGFSSATFEIWFVNVANNQKYQGNGVWNITDLVNGVFQYTLSNTDLSNAYATTGSSNPGTAIFDICVEITISTEVYDPQPSRIAIRKI